MAYYPQKGDVYRDTRNNSLSTVDDVYESKELRPLKFVHFVDSKGCSQSYALNLFHKTHELVKETIESKIKLLESAVNSMKKEF